MESIRVWADASPPSNEVPSNPPSIAITTPATVNEKRIESSFRVSVAPQMLRQVHEDRGGGAPDEMFRMRPDPILPPSPLDVLPLAPRRVRVEHDVERKLEHRIHLV